MHEIITTRDIYVSPPRLIKETSYFAMHLAVTERNKLEREADINFVSESQ